MQGDFRAFYDSALTNSNKLFVMIVDECHYGATRQQAHDTYVNDHNWHDDGNHVQHGPQKGRGHRPAGTADLLEQDNFLTLLVSATPYSVLTDSSRIPDSLFVPCQLSSHQLGLARQARLHPLDVLIKKGDTWQVNASYPSPGIEIAPTSHVRELMREKVCCCCMCLTASVPVQSTLC